MQMIASGDFALLAYISAGHWLGVTETLEQSVNRDKKQSNSIASHEAEAA
jgi:hypothetical protein